MANAPIFDIDVAAFRQNPYPILEVMRREAPIAYVPALDAVLVTRRDDIFTLEKKIEISKIETDDVAGVLEFQ